jgi:hypothetical protein
LNLGKDLLFEVLEFLWGFLMSKRVLIVVRLIPEASRVADKDLLAEIKREVSKSVSMIPWADCLVSVEIKE